MASPPKNFEGPTREQLVKKKETLMTPVAQCSVTGGETSDKQKLNPTLHCTSQSAPYLSMTPKGLLDLESVEACKAARRGYDTSPLLTCAEGGGGGLFGLESLSKRFNERRAALSSLYS